MADPNQYAQTGPQHPVGHVQTGFNQVSYQMPPVKSRQHRQMQAQLAEQQATGHEPVLSAGPSFQPLTPGMVQPGMVQPGMVQPGMVQPGMVQPGMSQPPSQQFGAMSLRAGPLSPQQHSEPDPRRTGGKLDVMTLPRPHLSDKISTYLTREMHLPPAATTLFTVDDRGSCSPKFMRSTLYQVPTTKEMMAQSQLPFSVVLQPFTDGALEQRDVPIVNMGDEGPLRCRRCRAYVNPFVNFIDNGAQYQCRLCGCANEVPSEYFAPLDINGQRVDLAQRPELVHGTVDFVAPKDMQGKLLTPPPVAGTTAAQQAQPAQWVPSYVFVIDTSVAAVQSGLLASFVACVKQLLAELFAESHYRFGFITFDSTVHFYNLASTAKRPQLMTVGEVHNMFLPMPTANMLVRYAEHKTQIDELLDKLPVMFQHTGVNESALGAALNAAALMLSNTGGKVFVLQAGRPMFGPGAIKPREDLKLMNTDKEKTLLMSDNVYFKKLGEECLKRAVSIDMIVAPNAYVDLASISEVSHVTQGRVYYMPHFDVHRDHATLWHTLRRSLSHRIVFEAALRVRASSGISVASYDLGGLPHAGPDVSLAAMDATTTLAVTLTHDESLEDRPDKPVLVQCAVAHTTPYGQRMIRVHTLALRTTPTLLNAYRAIDLDALLGHLSRTAVIDTTNLSLTEARARLVDRSAKLLAGYRKYCAKSSAEGQLVLPDTLKHFPLYISGMLKHPLLSNLSPIWAHVVSITDQRVAFMRMFADQPLDKLGTLIHPHLFALHKLDEEDGRIHAGFTKLPDISRLSMEMVRPDGIYLLHDTLQIFIYFGPNASHELLQQLFPTVDPSQVPSLELAHLPFARQENDFSQRVWNIIEWLQASSLYFPKVTLVRPRDPNIAKFAALLIEDERSVPGKVSKKGSQDVLSYSDFLVHIHNRIRDSLN